MPAKITSGREEAELLLYKAEAAEEGGRRSDAYKYMSRAAKLGHPSAEANLGNYFSEGIGVKKSGTEAAYWYKRAYRHGNDTGAFNLALDYLRKGNQRAATFWLKKAQALGSGEATFELAKMYLGRARGKSKALALLQAIQSMGCSQIDADTKGEAMAILRLAASP